MLLPSAACYTCRAKGTGNESKGQMAESEPTDGEGDREPRMTLGEHLDELRKRIILALLGLLLSTALSLCLAREMLHLLEYPYVAVMQRHGLAPDLLAIGGWVGLGIWFKIGVYAGLVAASPWVFCQLWMFVSAGLRPKEKRYVIHAVPWSAGLFLGGAAFFLAVVARPLWYSLIGFNLWLGLETKITIENYVDLTTGMMVVFGLAFQLPLAIYMLGLMGIVNTRLLNKYRRHVIVGIFTFAAAVSSPSGLDMIILGVAMWLLYEAGVLMVYFLQKKRARQEAAEGEQE